MPAIKSREVVNHQGGVGGKSTKAIELAECCGDRCCLFLLTHVCYTTMTIPIVAGHQYQNQYDYQYEYE